MSRIENIYIYIPSKLTLAVGSLLGLEVVGFCVGLTLIGCLVGSFVGSGVLHKYQKEMPYQGEHIPQ